MSCRPLSVTCAEISAPADTLGHSRSNVGTPAYLDRQTTRSASPTNRSLSGSRRDGGRVA